MTDAEYIRALIDPCPEGFVQLRKKNERLETIARRLERYDNQGIIPTCSFEQVKKIMDDVRRMDAEDLEKKDQKSKQYKD